MVHTTDDLLVVAGDAFEIRWIFTKGSGSSTIKVWDEECKRLALAIAPGGDIVLVEPFGCRLYLLPFRIGEGCQFASSSDGFLTIFISMIKIRSVDADGDKSREEGHQRGDDEATKCFASDCFDKVANDDAQDEEGEVVAHLHVIGQDLQCSKESRHCTS